MSVWVFSGMSEYSKLPEGSKRVRKTRNIGKSNNFPKYPRIGDNDRLDLNFIEMLRTRIYLEFESTLQISEKSRL